MGIFQELGKGVGEAVKPALVEVVDNQFDKWIPIAMAGLSKTVLEGLKHFAVGGVDKITDAIPGEADDAFIDPFIGKLVGEWLPQVFPKQGF